MEESQEQPEGAAPKRDIVTEFRKNPAAEKILAAAALGVLLGFIFNNSWGLLFKYSWFPTLAFFGAVLVLTLVIVDLFGVKFMDAKWRVRVLILLAILPVAGFIIDALRDFWSALMIAGAVVMAYAAAKITTREGIIRKQD